jgi:hypothetical protein
MICWKSFGIQVIIGILNFFLGFAWGRYAEKWSNEKT